MHACCDALNQAAGCPVARRALATPSATRAKVGSCHATPGQCLALLLQGKDANASSGSLNIPKHNKANNADLCTSHALLICAHGNSGKLVQTKANTNAYMEQTTARCVQSAQSVYEHNVAQFACIEFDGCLRAHGRVNAGSLQSLSAARQEQLVQERAGDV